MCIPISDLLQNSAYTVIRGVFNEKNVWVLKDNQQKTVAYQAFEEGIPPFEGVYCLLETQCLPPDPEQTLAIKAFLTGPLN